MEMNRNFLIAMALSIMVLVGWQFLVIGPRMDEQQRQNEIAQNEGSLQTPQTPAGSDQDSLTAPSGRESMVPSPNLPQNQSREQVIAGGNRVTIDTPELTGSINLTGARLDDLRLKHYHETVDDSSPTIVLLSPEELPNGYFAEYGLIQPGTGQLVGANTEWQAEDGAELTPDTPVTLTATTESGLTVTRRISVDDNFMFTYEDTVENTGDAAVQVSPYGRIARYSKPEVAAAFVLFEGLLGVFGEEGLDEVSYSDIEDDTRLRQPASSGGGWLGITDKYWATALVPEVGRDFESQFLYRTNGRSHYQTEFVSDPVSIAPGAAASMVNRTFAGAKEVDKINAYEEQLNIRQFGQLIDWGWFYFITRPMFTALDYIYRLVGNFGIAILAVTVILKLIFFPLANKSYKSMARMKTIQPKVMELRERFKDDRQKQQQEMMQLYRSEKINPAAGCWPILIQIPVFFALYKVLYVTIEMRHAPFFGWIQDLAAPDPTSIFNLFGLLPYDVPGILLIGVWPLLMGLTMFIQMRLNPTPPDPTQAMIFTWMPVVFTFMLATFPAGLVIYWTWNNFLSIIQQSVIMKRNGAKIELFDNLRGMFKRKEKPSES
ncbi:putative inner membrane transmembrane protein [Fulvimarina pelagi HTCC2506]|uniref:Membrane protein insertase YidC n=1 Tax=Fulvimarina pelagi HTCC2506 TaxID=314231 RepID=Q0G0U0_9HYPH|nr:membrane protein insertase YidC [Fulvimarina pelagi]EAU40899.1 putative inner membrane transmembrane protein [Fulvimarina pelagi HTCC2506]